MMCSAIIAIIERERDFNYHLIDDGGNCKSPETAGVCIGDEGSEQRRQASSSSEVGESVSSFG